MAYSINRGRNISFIVLFDDTRVDITEWMFTMYFSWPV